MQNGVNQAETNNGQHHQQVIFVLGRCHMSSKKDDHDYLRGWRPKAAVRLVIPATFALTGAKRLPQSDSLPSWNDSPVNQSIITFVNKATAKGSSDFVAESGQLAVSNSDVSMKDHWKTVFAFPKGRQCA